MLSPRDPMCKMQRSAGPVFVLLCALGAACSGRSRTAREGEVGFVGDRGGAWPGGIGAVLRFRASEGRLTVHRAPPDGAAARAGLREGDVIDAIDGEPVAGRAEREVVTALRGEVGTVVVLRLRGGDGGAGRDVRVERAPYRRAAGD